MDEQKLECLRAIIRPMMQDRPYHNVGHVEACVKALRHYNHLTEDPPAIELALWLHDAVYDPAGHDNEAKSAEFGDELLTELGCPPAVISKVRDLILATRHDADPGTQDGRLIADIDLLILAATPEAFARYEQQIRQEYLHVPDRDFARGRARVLTKFLERNRLYYLLHEHEAAARDNLRRAIAAWQVGGS